MEALLPLLGSCACLVFILIAHAVKIDNLDKRIKQLESRR